MSYGPLKAALRGVAFTNPTPFSEDGSAVLHDELAANLERLAEAGAELVIPCGNTGEYYSLSHRERVDVVRTTVEAVGDRMTVVAGAGGSLPTALELLAAYEDAGVDGVMVMYPGHTYVHERGIREYYERLADATDLGLVLYKRGPLLSVDAIAALAERENVVGVKFAVNDVKEFSAAVDAVDGDVVWSNGIAERFAPAFAVEGAEGFTTGVGNFAPEPVLALQAALETEDYRRARELRDLLRPYENLREEDGGGRFAAANNVPAVKHGLDLAGGYGGPVRPPLVDLAAADRERCEAYYADIEAATGDLATAD